MNEVLQANSAELALPQVASLAARSSSETSIPGVSHLMASTCAAPVSLSIRYGQLVRNGNPVYVVGDQGLIWIPNPSVFYSWCFNFNDVLQANAAELALPQTGTLATRNPSQTTIPGVSHLNVTTCSGTTT
jgi:hypothetical protein